MQRTITVWTQAKLYVEEARYKGPTMKRVHPRAQGRGL